MDQIGYTNIPDAEPYQFSGFKHISKLFVVGMLWHDWVIVFIVLIILILLIILLIKIIRYRKLKHRNKESAIKK